MELKRRRWGQKEKVRGEGDILWQNVIFVTLTWGKRTEEKAKDSGQGNHKTLKYEKVMDYRGGSLPDVGGGLLTDDKAGTG